VAWFERVAPTRSHRRGGTAACGVYNLKTRSAFWRRNFGHTSSLKGT
jgi:hypothetical protein